VLTYKNEEDTEQVFFWYNTTKVPYEGLSGYISTVENYFY
jgi:hypothetical protein